MSAAHSATPPVLLLIFNRPDLTRRVFERIRLAEPAQLFVAADGPRSEYEEDIELCRDTRSIIQELDWECELHTLFRDENLGLKQAVSSAISWFLDQVGEGIILEDDCLPDETFFPYCAELLERYRYDERIMVISGNNFIADHLQFHASYYFSIYTHIWGWATWHRAWRHFDGAMQQWPQVRNERWLESLLGDDTVADYWHRLFDQVYCNQLNSWAYAWNFSCWAQSGLTILPTMNLVSNVGFDSRATHTTNVLSRNANIPSQAVTFPLIHPELMVRDYGADRLTGNIVLGVPSRVSGLRRLAKWCLNRMPKPLVDRMRRFDSRDFRL